MLIEQISKFKNKMFEPIDIAILVYFRIIFGAIMLWEVLKYFSSGWISRYWIDPPFNFTYYGFDWVKPLPGDGMFYLFGIMGVLSIFIIIGFKYRIVTTLFFIGFTYTFLLEQTRFLNHFYLISLISFLMIFVPAHKALSIDSWLNKKSYSDFAPYWSLWILKFQIAIVYFFGGIQKINYDWLHGEPMRHWLSEKTDFPILGAYFTEEWMVYLLSYSALGLDLLAIPFLMWKKSRWIAFGFLVAFHVMNSQLFTIGVFPWFMILAVLIFFDPSWPRLGKWKKSQNKTYFPKTSSGLTKNQKIVFAMLMIFVIFQTTMPLRHYFYPDYEGWTDEAHLFSWTMKLRDKHTDELTIRAIDHTTGKIGVVNPMFDLTREQLSKLSHSPDLMVQYSHYLIEELKSQGYSDNVEIRIESWVSLNGREPQLLIDPNIDLTKQEPTIFHKDWIMPFNNTQLGTHYEGIVFNLNPEY